MLDYKISQKDDFYHLSAFELDLLGELLQSDLIANVLRNCLAQIFLINVIIYCKFPLPTFLLQLKTDQFIIQLLAIFEAMMMKTGCHI